jgi:hypothetical protein
MDRHLPVDDEAEAATVAGFTLDRKLKVKPGGVMSEKQTAYDYEARLALLDAETGTHCGYIDLCIRQRLWDDSSGMYVPGLVRLSMPWYTGYSGPYPSVILDLETSGALDAAFIELFEKTGMELILPDRAD